MSGLDYAQAIKLLTKKMKDGGDLNLSETMWNAIIAAVTDESAIYDPMPDPDFSLEEMDQAETVIKSLGPR